MSTINCPVCGSEGARIYRGMLDEAYKTSGSWDVMKCSGADCKTLWLEPYPEPDQIPGFYPKNYFTHSETNRPSRVMPLLGRYDHYLRSGYLASRYGYSEKNIKWAQRTLGVASSIRVGWRTFVGDDIMFLPSTGDKVILDVGCGSGEFLDSMAGLNWHTNGCDIDPVCVEKTKRRGHSAKLVKNGILPYADGQFDAVTVRHAIEHVPGADAVLRECRRVLKTNGLISIATPNSESLGHRYFGRWWLGLDVPRHLTIYSPNSLQAVIERNGFEVVRCFTNCASASTNAKMSMDRKKTANETVPFLYRKYPNLFGKIFMLIESALLVVGFRNKGDDVVIIGRKT